MRSPPVKLGSPAGEQEAKWGEGWSPDAQPHFVRFLPRHLGEGPREPPLETNSKSTLSWSSQGLLAQDSRQDGRQHSLFAY